MKRDGKSPMPYVHTKVVENHVTSQPSPLPDRGGCFGNHLAGANNGSGPRHLVKSRWDAVLAMLHHA